MDVIQEIGATLARFDLRSLLDVLLIAAIFYWLLLLLRRTTAMSLLRGIVIVLLAGFLLSNILQLTMLGWLLKNSVTALFVAIPIVFQPELRRALERVGRAGFRNWLEPPKMDKVIDIVIRACHTLSERRYGALVVLERETGLQDYIDTGIRVDGTASIELLVGMFFPNSPLHDGAVILRGDRIVAASCVLPLSDSLGPSAQLGMRHRAAIGITERTDALSVVVSEGTGIISVASNGRIVQRLDEARLRRLLTSLYQAPSPQRFTPWRRRR